MKPIVLFAFVLGSFSLRAQEISIIPKPVKTEWGKGSFNLNKETTILTNSIFERNSANFLNNYIEQFYGFRLKTDVKPGSIISDYGQNHQWPQLNTAVIH